ncbi:MAG: hypothetical protein WBZ20_04680 [Nitrososphaeraceae archaeon]
MLSFFRQDRFEVRAIIIYAKAYKNTKAVFITGLMFFIGLLMLPNIVAVYACFAMEPLYAIGLLPYFAGIHIAELAGLSVLFRVTFL